MKDILRLVFHIVILILLLLLVLFILKSEYVYGVLEQPREEKGVKEDEVRLRLNEIFSKTNIFPGGVVDDLLFLSNTYCLQNWNSVKDYDFLESCGAVSNFQQFVSQYSVYYDLSLVNVDNREIFHVNNNQKVFRADRKDVKEQRKRDFEDVLKIRKGEVYLSSLELQKEEVEGVVFYTPLLRYSILIYDKSEVLRGVLVARVYADYFLSDIRQSQREGEFVYLVNNDGFYLANPDKSKEFSHLLKEGEHNIFNDFHDIEKKKFDDEIRGLETEKYIYTFYYIYPENSNFAIAKEVYNGSYWVLVGISEKQID